jgi:hypothetical protein
VLFARYAKRWEAVRPESFLPSPEQTALDEVQGLLHANVADRTSLAIYRRAVQELRGYFHIFVSEATGSLDVTDLFIWIHEIIDDFILLLQVPTQEALVVFAYFCVLLKRLVGGEHGSWIRWPVAQITE